LTRLRITNPHECTGRIAFVCAFHCGILFDAIDSAHEISVNETWAHIIHLFTSTARIWAHDMCSDFVDPIPSIAFVILFYPIAIFPAFTVEYIFWIIITIWYLCQGPCKIKVSIMALQLMTMIRVVRYCAKFEMGFFIHHSNEGDFTRGATYIVIVRYYIMLGRFGSCCGGGYMKCESRSNVDLHVEKLMQYCGKLEYCVAMR